MEYSIFIIIIILTTNINIKSGFFKHEIKKYRIIKSLFWWYHNFKTALNRGPTHIVTGKQG